MRQRLIQLLSPHEAKEFDTPPIFNKQQRQRYFSFSGEAKKHIEQLQTPVTKIGFILQYGYCKATGQCYTPSTYRAADIAYVCKQLGIPYEKNRMDNYHPRTYRHHKSIILKLLNLKKFTQQQSLFTEKVQEYSQQYIHPKKVLLSLTEFLSEEKIEVPSYATLAITITKAFHRYENTLLDTIATTLTLEQSELLDDLTRSEAAPYQRSLLTRLKTINQSIKPGEIKKSVHGFLIIKQLYHELLPLIEALDLSPEATRYYAVWTVKAKVTQINEMVDSHHRYLYLIAFVAHQFKIWHDVLLEVLLKCVRKLLNQAEVMVNALNAQGLPRKNELTLSLIEGYKAQHVSIEQAQHILYHEMFNHEEKVIKLRDIIPPILKEKEDEAKIDPLETTLTELEKVIHDENDNKHYYAVLAQLSRKLQIRVGDIVRYLMFVIELSEAGLAEAITYYQEKRSLTKEAPHQFLTDAEKNSIYKDDGFNISLYKAVLFVRVFNAIKQGKISLSPSYRYLPISAYMIDEETWHKDREKLLAKAGLIDFVDVDKLLADLEGRLDKRYYEVNLRIVNGENTYVTVKKNGNYTVHTPALDKPTYEPILDLIANDGYVSILQMMAQINQATHFTAALRHHKVKGAKQPVTDEIFYAGLFALGTNIDLHKLGNTALGINYNTLDNAVNWYFSLDNLTALNKKLVARIRKMWLPNQFKREYECLHTSSDAKKYGISVESLNSNESFKYFGKGKGANVYLFIDERGILFYTTVFSSAERDAAYVLDGLVCNEEIQSDMHSTDTHGYTDLVFAVTHFMKIQFAPRLKDITIQRLVSFKRIRHKLLKKNYPILPDSSPINTALIKQYWDTILRLVTSVKLKEHRPSTIIKRINSYDGEHPLQKALQAFGQIIKSCFILDYIDDVQLCQKIEKQLNKGELANRFSSAMTFSNNQMIRQVDRDDQEIVAMCRTILQNIIILWNYIELTKLLIRTDESERAALVEQITNGSILTWAHVNLLGIYDFRDLLSHNDVHYGEDTDVINFKVA